MPNIGIIPLEQLSLKHRIIQWFLVLGLMATSGVPLFFGTPKLAVGFFAICVVFVVLLRIKLERYLVYILIFGLLIVLQSLYFGISLYLSTAMLQIILFLTGLLAASVIGINFTDIYVKAMVFFSIISLILFVPIRIHYPFYELIYTHFPIRYESSFEFYDTEFLTRSIFFLNFPYDFELRTRNTSIFWEPGAHGGFLMLAFILQTIKTKKLFNWQNLVFAATIVTTFSTTTYLTFFLFVSGYYALSIKNTGTRLFLIIILAGGFTIIYNSVDFLGNKITAELEKAADEMEEYGGNGRAASTLLDLQDLTEKPLYIFMGRGAHPETRYGGVDKNVFRTNGVTDQLVRWGVPFFLFYLALITQTFKRYCNIYGANTSFAVLGLVTFLVFVTGETYLQYSLFWMLFFLHIPLSNYLKHQYITDEKTEDQTYQQIERSQMGI